MSDDVDTRLAPVVARERAAMERGDTLAEVLARLRDAHGLGTIEQFHVIRSIKHINFGIAKQLVFDYRHLPLVLDDLALLATVPRYCKQAWWLVAALDWAMLHRERMLRVDDAKQRSELAAAIAEDPAWRREIVIERDEPDHVLLRFVRVPRRR